MKKIVNNKLFFLALLFLVFCSESLAQTTDLMIVEYVDTDSPFNDGYGVKIKNPTSNSINLSNYYLKLFHNGNTASTPTADFQLSGTLNPGSTIVVGNEDYCNLCPSYCDIEVTSVQGVNENDVVAITKGNTTIFADMIGAYKANVNPKVGDTAMALLHHKLIRECTNTIRYFNQASASGPTNNAWYNSSLTSLPGWKVESISCLVDNELPEINLNLPDSVICSGDLVVYSLDTLTYDSIFWYLDGVQISNIDTIAINATGEYTVNVFSDCSTARDTFEIINNQAIDIDFSDTTICFNDSLIINLDSLVLDSIRWHSEYGTILSDSNYVVFTEEDIIYVEIYKNVCFSLKDTFFLDEIKDYSKGFVSVIEDAEICDNDTFSYVISNTTPETRLSWEWYKMDELISTDSIFITKDSGLYYLKSYFVCNAETVDTFQIDFKECVTPPPTPEDTTLLIPNVFSPNGDNINDWFMLKGMGKTEPINIKIFNRWGKLMYSSDDYKNNWDGKNCPDGLYYYHILQDVILSNGNKSVFEVKGWVQILR